MTKPTERTPEPEEVLQYEPIILLKWLEDEFIEDVPANIETIDEMERASKMILRITANFTYLTALSQYADLAVRSSKRLMNTDKKNEEYKMRYEDMVDRRKVIDRILEILKQQYAAISRCITIRSENNKELQMNGGVIY